MGGRVALEVDVDDLRKDAGIALLPILRLIKGWEHVSIAGVSVEQLSGAMTNLVYKCKASAGGEELGHAIVRVFGGTDGLFDREQERCIFATLSQLGLGPHLLADFINGRVEEFWYGHSVTAQQMREPWVASSVAKAMASLHWYAPAILGDEGGMIWERIWDWHRQASHLWNGRFQEWDLLDLTRQIEALRRQLQAQHPEWTAFCHNDLQYGNMLLFSRLFTGATSAKSFASSPANGSGSSLSLSSQSSPPSLTSEHSITRKRGTPKLKSASSVGSLSDEERSFAPSVRFIDFEYASWNHVAFDVANHWCEYAADYHADPPHLLDFSKFPDETQQYAFTYGYVRSLVKLRRQTRGRPLALPRIANGDVSQESVDGLIANCVDDDSIEEAARRLQAAAVAYVPLSHVHWALWGLMQAKTSKVDFNFEEYSAQRLVEFARNVGRLQAVTKHVQHG